MNLLDPAYLPPAGETSAGHWRVAYASRVAARAAAENKQPVEVSPLVIAQLEQEWASRREVGDFPLARVGAPFVPSEVPGGVQVSETQMWWTLAFREEEGGDLVAEQYRITGEELSAMAARHAPEVMRVPVRIRAPESPVLNSHDSPEGIGEVLAVGYDGVAMWGLVSFRSAEVVQQMVDAGQELRSVTYAPQGMSGMSAVDAEPLLLDITVLSAGEIPGQVGHPRLSDLLAVGSNYPQRVSAALLAAKAASLLPSDVVQRSSSSGQRFISSDASLVAAALTQRQAIRNPKSAAKLGGFGAPMNEDVAPEAPEQERPEMSELDKLRAENARLAALVQDQAASQQEAGAVEATVEESDDAASAQGEQVDEVAPSELVAAQPLPSAVSAEALRAMISEGVQAGTRDLRRQMEAFRASVKADEAQKAAERGAQLARSLAESGRISADPAMVEQAAELLASDAGGKVEAFLAALPTRDFSALRNAPLRFRTQDGKSSLALVPPDAVFDDASEVHQRAAVEYGAAAQSLIDDGAPLEIRGRNVIVHSKNMTSEHKRKHRSAVENYVRQIGVA